MSPRFEPYPEDVEQPQFWLQFGVKRIGIFIEPMQANWANEEGLIPEAHLRRALELESATPRQVEEFVTKLRASFYADRFAWADNEPHE